MKCFQAELHASSGLDEEQMKVLECGVRWAVENKRTGRGGEQEQTRKEEQEQTTGQEQGKKVRCREEEQSEETRAESTDEPEVTSRFVEMRTGRGSADLVRGGDERCWADETSRKKQRKR